MRSVLVGLSLLMLICACGDAAVPTAPAAPRGDAGTKPDSGPSYMRDGGAADSGMAMALGPKVTFVSPLPALDPNADELITEPTLKVACKVERAARSGAAAVDKTTVKIGLQLVGEDDKETWIEPPVNAAADDTFEAQFELGGSANGRLHFRCVARDLAATPNTTTATLDTLLDLGPRLEILSPEAAPYALKNPVPIEFKVEAYPLSEVDNEAEVAGMILKVAGVETPFEESDTTPGLYQTSVDFDDRLQFPVPPQSAQVVVEVTNKRSPKAATRSAKVDVGIDGDGPSIIVKSPGDGQIVHGEIVLEVEVKDPSGILPSSLVATVNQELLVIRTWEGVQPVFKHRFDTRAFGTELTRLTLAITAMDAVGNERTVAHTLKLDNLPPVISLDPPPIREWHKVGEVLECSAPFDPLGTDVPNDEAKGVVTSRYRALVEDRTNQPVVGPNDPAPITYVAGVDRDSVEIFMQRDPSTPLLINTDSDPECDEINYDALEAVKRPSKLKLAPVNAAGTPYYPFQSDADTAPCLADWKTAPPIVQPTHPLPLCAEDRTHMHRVVPARVDGRPPAVYAIRPTNSAAAGECHGEYWELAGFARPGWICMAARAKDNIGNIGVSEPLRLCYGEDETCPEAPPPCTDGCTISVSQRFHSSDFWYFP